MAREKMLKMRLNRGSIVWIGETMSPMSRYRFAPDDLPIVYMVKLCEPYARVNGSSMVDRPPIELLQTMGIKVADLGGPQPYHNPATYRRYKIIGCEIHELVQQSAIDRGLTLDLLAIDHLRRSNLVGNIDLEPLLKQFNEPLFTLPDIKIQSIEQREEEGWIVV